MAASEDEHNETKLFAHYIPIEQLLSLNELLWIILAARRNGQVIPLIRMKQN